MFYKFRWDIVPKFLCRNSAMQSHTNINCQTVTLTMTAVLETGKNAAMCTHIMVTTFYIKHTVNNYGSVMCWCVNHRGTYESNAAQLANKKFIFKIC